MKDSKQELEETLVKQHMTVANAFLDNFDDVDVLISVVARKGTLRDSMAVMPSDDAEAQKQLLTAAIGGLRQANGWNNQEIADFIWEALRETGSSAPGRPRTSSSGKKRRSRR